MTLIQSLSRIDDFLSQNVPDQLSLWGHGLNDEQINDLVKDIPFFFPEEVREL
jgi:cell wall assembly regulator SMI1